MLGETTRMKQLSILREDFIASVTGIERVRITRIIYAESTFRPLDRSENFGDKGVNKKAKRRLFCARSIDQSSCETCKLSQFLHLKSKIV